jgi:phage terminase small subunit
LAKPEPKLTAKQTAFVSEFLVDGNATAAAKRSGYSERTAEKIGSENLSKPEIAKAIAAKQAKRYAKQDITAERILAELARVAFLDVGKMLNDDGAMKPISELDADTRAAIAGLELSEIRDEDGKPIGTLKKIKIADKLVALDKLARNFGLLQDKLKISGDAENPIKMLIERIQGSAIKPVHEGRDEDGA